MPEARSRISLLLPAPSSQPEFLLLNDVLDELIGLCGGVTVSSIAPSVFDGWWIDGDANALRAYLQRLKIRCQHDFHQEIVWIVHHPIERISEGDGNRGGV
jgi:hypothetical protein